MSNLRYTGASGRAIELDGPVNYVGVAVGLGSRAWAYDLGFREIHSARRVAREVELELAAPYAQLDLFRRITEADISAQTPGTLTVGGWSQRAYVAASKPQTIGPTDAITTLTVLLMDGAWWRLRGTDFKNEATAVESEDLDYPYDHPHDYGRTPAPDAVESATLTPSPVHIVIYGPAVNPYIIVGGNRYQVDTTVPSGSRLEVDGMASTITTTSARGVVVDHFADGVRATGEGGGAYIFEPLPAGPQDVTWDGSFGFTFGWYEMEGEPPWNALD